MMPKGGGMSSFKYIFGLIVVVLLVGLILRYGNSSNALAGDFNKFIGLITLQGTQGGAPTYYGPNS